MSGKSKSPTQTVSEILKENLKRRADRNPAYSVRAFARDLGLSPGYLSLVTSGKKRLSVERAAEIADSLDLKERERRRFLKAVAMASIKSGDRVSDLARLLSEPGYTQAYQELELDRFQYFNSWYHVAISDLATCTDFQSEIAWIAERLDLEIAVAKSAVDRLLRLGILKNEKGTYVKTNRFVSIPTTAPNNTIRNFHSQMIERAKQTLDRQTPEDFARRNISSITFSVAESKIELAKQKVAEFKREMAELSDGEPCTEVYQLNVQLFPLTSAKKPKKTGES